MPSDASSCRRLWFSAWPSLSLLRPGSCLLTRRRSMPGRGPRSKSTNVAVYTLTARPGPVVDVTGAGDLFAAGILYGLTAGFEPELCARLGCLSAGEVIRHVGARPRTDLLELVHRELNSRLGRLHEPNRQNVPSGIVIRRVFTDPGIPNLQVPGIPKSREGDVASCR